MHGYETDTVVRLETNLDDLSPELTALVMDRLFQAGALDVWFTPIQMKKNRPGVMLSVLCEEEAEAKAVEIIFAETSAFGLRRETIRRIKLQRRFEDVKTPYGEVRIKVGLKENKIVQCSPELESCREIAGKARVSVKEVYVAAQSAAARFLSE